METKKCSLCSEVKNIDLFYKHPLAKDGRLSRCKSCMNKITKQSRNNVAHRAKWREYALNHDLKLRYGITRKQYDEMLSIQNNKCLICGNTPTPEASFNKRRLDVDHCHKTKKVRGLLCHLCNRGIGLFRERTDLLQKAIVYLNSH